MADNSAALSTHREGRPAGGYLIGWVRGDPVTTAELVDVWSRLGRSGAGARLGLAGAAELPGPAPGGAHGAPLGTAAPFERTGALQAWAAKTLLTDRLFAAHAARLRLVPPFSLPEMARRLAQDGEIQVGAPSEADALAFYNANPSRYHIAEARKVRHVLVASWGKARDIRQRAGASLGLADLALDVSIDEGTRRRGGDLGWVERGQLSGALEDAIFATRCGQLRGPVRSAFGWHVLQVEAVREEGCRRFEECRDEIVADIREDRLRDAWQQWWDCRVAEEISVVPGWEHPALKGHPGTGHRH